jgi:CRISPR/Cas system-associated exonuclease Cas4 (RecB family)
VTSAGVVLADVPVTVTFTATGSALGYTTNSVSSTVSVTRIVVDP